MRGFPIYAHLFKQGFLAIMGNFSKFTPCQAFGVTYNPPTFGGRAPNAGPGGEPREGRMAGRMRATVHPLEGYPRRIPGA